MAKGSSFERMICKQISLWWTDNKREDVFWRTAGSGAMAKTRKKKNKNTFGQYGDIQATDPIGQPLIDVFTIELKRGYSKNTFFDLFDRTDKAAQQQWDKFICQVLEDQKNSGAKYWMLICKRDRRDPVILMPLKVAKKLPGMNRVNHMRGVIELKDKRKIKYYLCKWNELLEIDPNIIESLSE